MGLLRYFICLLVFSLLMGCQNPSSKAPPGAPAQPDTIAYTFDKIERSGPCADTAARRCLEIRIETMKLTSGTNSPALQKMEKYLNGQISATDNTGHTANEPTQIADDLQSEYSRILSEMKDYRMPWEYFREFDIYLNENGLFGTRLQAHSFTGGAHPADFNYYYLFKTGNGTLIGWKDLFLPKFRGQVLEEAEKRFRFEQEIDSNLTYEAAGFWFENNDFYLPDNFRYTAEGLRFLYNPYEIAPYSEGSINIKLGYDRIENWLKPEYRFKSVSSPRSASSGD